MSDRKEVEEQARIMASFYATSTKELFTELAKKEGKKVAILTNETVLKVIEETFRIAYLAGKGIYPKRLPKWMFKKEKP